MALDRIFPPVFGIILVLVSCTNDRIVFPETNGTDIPESPDDPFKESDPDRELFVLSGGSGDQSGRDWTNALPDLPDDLLRGYTYYIGEGSYVSSGYTFATEEYNEQWVFIVKATPGDHGTDVGWSDALGDGETIFGAFAINTGHLYLSGGATNKIRIVGSYRGSTAKIDGNHVYLRYIDFDGDFQTNSEGNHVRGSCSGLAVTADDVSIIGSTIHDVADDGVTISSSSRFFFQSNTIVDLANCGTDNDCGPCYNGHSDGLEIHDVTDSRFIGNFVRLDEATACVFFANWDSNRPERYNRSIRFVNNIFYKNGGFIAYFQDFDDLKLYNNTFWGIQQGRFGGISIGKNATRLDMMNNIILSANFEYQDAAFDEDEHHGDFNIIAADIGSPNYELGENDVLFSDPRFTGANQINDPFIPHADPKDFTTSSQSHAVDAGTVLTDVATDYYGLARPVGMGWDIGAFEQ